MANISPEAKILIEKLEKLTGKKVVVTEGTWALTDKMGTYHQAKLELEAFKDKYYHSIGDDDLFDHLDGAVKRVEELQQYAENRKKA